MKELIKVHQNCNSELTISCSNTVSKIIVEFENTRIKRVEVQQITGNDGNTKD